MTASSVWHAQPHSWKPKSQGMQELGALLVLRVRGWTVCIFSTYRVPSHTSVIDSSMLNVGIRRLGVVLDWDQCETSVKSALLAHVAQIVLLSGKAANVLHVWTPYLLPLDS
ncbi:hypothetical protein HBI56_140270 [Parastagonospora nodorum]|nr:hypothetical protein HBI10_155620 [Parastagonospora nodorum]KAH4019099.1 hypothetical protein HBI13_130450 [Parastagonospora nodorum]KAH4028587.1 hypothetical protein HBI09_139130 [Parastagonospora nodorum]KAH4070652.1 hypothetical protein HBH50_086680 [Parastagonospora nodorum]KAH4093081.1 hypothetical protein HBH48_076680 [Parastagonospora nodorum]